MSKPRSVREPVALSDSCLIQESAIKDSGSDKPGTDPRSVKLPSRTEGATIQGRLASQPRDDVDDQSHSPQPRNSA